MGQLDNDDAGTPPATVCAYIESMLAQLVLMAGAIGEAKLAGAIESATAVARGVNDRIRAEAQRADGHSMPAPGVTPLTRRLI